MRKRSSNIFLLSNENEKMQDEQSSKEVKHMHLFQHVMLQEPKVNMASPAVADIASEPPPAPSAPRQHRREREPLARL